MNVALAAGATYLVTWDNDLLDLMKAGNAEGEALKGRAPGLVILTPPDLLGLLRAEKASESPGPPPI